MATRSVNGLLTSVDSLFTTQQERDEANLKKIYDIPISEIDDFPEHPYQVNDDEDMDRLVESIKERGIITPATVRKKDDGRYELISGHRRKRACELAGLESLRCDIVELTRDEAIVLMVESNYQRSNILPSEKAFAYKMRLDAMNRQGKESKGMIIFSPLAQGLLTDRYLKGIPNDSRVRTDGRFLNEKSLSADKLDKIEKLNQIAQNRGQTLAQMALAWLYNREEITSVLIGASKPEQIVENIAMIENMSFTDEELKQIDSIAL